MIRVKIYGAGSIGNHLAYACRQKNWDVSVVDRDTQALKRMKEEIYSSRYGAWDSEIKLFTLQDQPRRKFDAIFIGTPPDTHLAIAIDVLKQEAPRVLQIEKPLCSPTLEGLAEFMRETRHHSDTAIIVGFNHLLAENTELLNLFIHKRNLGSLVSIDAEIRSSWKNIFLAHPWLAGPEDTYLGYWKRGGGAGGEHCHALNLWQYFAHQCGRGKVTEVSGTFEYIHNEKIYYDRLCFLTLKTDSGMVGRVAQDVVAQQKSKVARLWFERGIAEWHNDATKTTDQIIFQAYGKGREEIVIKKKRIDEFFREVVHINRLLDGTEKIENSPVRLERGIDTMLVLAAGHKSYANRKVVAVDYSIYSLL
ncbi:MAG: Gfo/Idh/MocA family oxidoreductase [Candidatus Niyogibacteria bacterium]|nr:Gfo/Idh/MocA family oxidoreductase [Candidatus Niyogibacteria bacterium]